MLFAELGIRRSQFSRMAFLAEKLLTEYRRQMHKEELTTQCGKPRERNTPSPSRLQERIYLCQRASGCQWETLHLLSQPGRTGVPAQATYGGKGGGDSIT